MASTANTEAISRTEFDAMIERMASRLAALERAAAPSPARIDEEGRPASGQSEVVTQNEFRLFKWLGTFLVAAVLGAFGVLYQQISDTRVEMRELHTTVIRELYAQIGSVREDLGSQIRSEVGGLRQEMKAEIGGLRQEMKAEIGGLRQEIGGLRQEMNANHDSIREEIGSLRERVVRIETLLVGEKPRTES
ncbi:MAG: hypothetical protein OXQ90_11675 [Gammaproteobacteria bacterium]|nr:hypothetical protein [Gammaproteobacteria bacterium]